MNKEINASHILIEDVRPNPYQPRRVFDQVALSELANSIKEYGVMQPITVRRLNENKFELIAGERRLRASKLAGKETVPAVIVEVVDQASAVLALVENLQRENLNYFEEAEGYANLLTDYNLTQEEVAKKVGKSQSTIANKLRLLKLSSAVRKMLAEGRLTERHARALLKLPSEEIQIKVLEKVIKNKLNVSKTEELIARTVDDILGPGALVSKNKKKRKVKRFIKDIRLFTNTIDKAVDIVKGSGVDVDYNINKGEEFYEISIKIPHNS